MVVEGLGKELSIGWVGEVDTSDDTVAYGKIFCVSRVDWQVPIYTISHDKGKEIYFRSKRKYANIQLPS